MALMLRPELEGRIQRKLESGDYETVEHLIESALDRLDDDHALGGMTLVEVQSKIEEGWAAAERGDTISGEDFEAEMDAWRARVSARL
jgi:antitoxin ParD1/3/4